jgi:hypothetical protein
MYSIFVTVSVVEDNYCLTHRQDLFRSIRQIRAIVMNHQKQSKEIDPKLKEKDPEEYQEYIPPKLKEKDPEESKVYIPPNHFAALTIHLEERTIVIKDGLRSHLRDFQFDVKRCLHIAKLLVGDDSEEDVLEYGMSTVSADRVEPFTRSGWLVVHGHCPRQNDLHNCMYLALNAVFQTVRPPVPGQVASDISTASSI